MKLLWVFSTFAIGGPQRRFATLANAFGGKHSHIIGAMDGCYDAMSLLSDNVAAERIELAAEKNTSISFSNIKSFRRIIANYSPDILLTSNWGTIEWRIANRGLAPQIHSEDGFGPDEAGGDRNQKRDFMRRALFSTPILKRKPFRLAAPSSDIAAIAKDHWGVPAASISEIPNGVDLENFAPVTRIERRPVTIGSVGAMRTEKRFDRLLYIFSDVAQNTAARLLLVGDGPERSKLQNLAVDLGINEFVEFAGNQNDVAPFLAEMDIFAMTSDTEQMPIGLVEAMATGLPVVASDVGDIRKMLADDNRQFVFDRESKPGFAAAFTQLANDADLRRQLGSKNASKARAEYSMEKMINAYEALFAEITN
ncbi:MAG: glycosyltransferase family 4 protein [Marinicaulis sp.]|nr:glycosyltransferase family 4 protein [Marinicaulis sp.]